MSWYDISEVYDATGAPLVLRVPEDGNDYSIALRVSGTASTNTATIKVQDSVNDGDSFAATATPTNQDGTTGTTITAAGRYLGDLTSSADYVRVNCTAHTAGGFRVEAVLIPQ